MCNRRRFRCQKRIPDSKVGGSFYEPHDKTCILNFCPNASAVLLRLKRCCSSYHTHGNFAGRCDLSHRRAFPVEWNAPAIQSRLRCSRFAESRTRRGRSSYGRLPAWQRICLGWFFLCPHWLGDSGGPAGPNCGSGYFCSAGWYSEPHDRVGALAGRNYHCRPHPAIS